MNSGNQPDAPGEYGSEYNLQLEFERIDNAIRVKITSLDGSRLLITGCAGFLGFNFLNYFHHLEQSGQLKFAKITAVDSFVRGEPEWLSDLSVKFDALDVVDADILDLELEPKFDYIIHAASIASPIFYRKFPIETIRVNSVGTDRLLNLALKCNNFKSFLFFSSSEIYGDPEASSIPTKEDYRGNVSCIGPRSCYDESKRLGETICYSYHVKYSLPVKIVRPFNNYGPGLKLADRRVIPDFFRSIIQHKELVLLSDGSATRTFCYVSDAVSGYLLALLSSYDGHVFNIGTEEPEISIKELAHKIRDITGIEAPVVFSESHDKQYLEHNPSRRCPDIQKARTMLGYSPQVTLEDGLAATFQYYKSCAYNITSESFLPL